MEIYMYAYIVIEWSWDIMTDVIEYMLHRPIQSVGAVYIFLYGTIFKPHAA